MSIFYYILTKHIIQSLYAEKDDIHLDGTTGNGNKEPEFGKGQNASSLLTSKVAESERKPEKFGQRADPIKLSNQQIFTILKSIFTVDEDANPYDRRSGGFGRDVGISDRRSQQLSPGVQSTPRTLGDVGAETTDSETDLPKLRKSPKVTEEVSNAGAFCPPTTHRSISKYSEISSIIRNFSHSANYNIYVRMISAIHICNYQRELNIATKFHYLSYLLINMFYSEDDKEQFRIIFGKTYQIYRGFSLLARLYKYKKIPPHNTCDLVLNPFNINFNDLHSILKHTKQQPFMLIQNGAKYFFSRVDLIRLLNTSLGNTFDFFAKPLVCSNPYNKIVFEYHDLYNIYLYIKEGHLKNYELIDAFHDCDFVLEKFLLQYDYLIREYAIKEYILNSPDDELYNDIIDMIDEYCPTIMIHEDFPRKKLIYVMKPYLYLYFISIYSLIPSKKNKYRKLFKLKIQNFNKYTPTFGRKIINTARSMFGDIIEGQSVNIRFIDHCIPLLLSEVM